VHEEVVSIDIKFVLIYVLLTKYWQYHIQDVINIYLSQNICGKSGDNPQYCEKIRQIAN
jgi:hypothetical protein